MNAKTDEEARNEQLIRSLYALAEGNAKDTSKFVSTFTDDGYFYDVSAGKRSFGSDIRVTADAYAAAFPDMHRELESLLRRRQCGRALAERHAQWRLGLGEGKNPATGKRIHAPCCDVFHIANGKITSFHCDPAVTIILVQLGVI